MISDFFPQSLISEYSVDLSSVGTYRISRISPRILLCSSVICSTCTVIEQSQTTGEYFYDGNAQIGEASQ